MSGTRRAFVALLVAVGVAGSIHVMVRAQVGQNVNVLPVFAEVDPDTGLPVVVGAQAGPREV